MRARAGSTAGGCGILPTILLGEELPCRREIEGTTRLRTAAGVVRVAVALLCRPGLVWVQKRRATGNFDGYWEFPGGKVESGETPVAALRREILEETGIRLSGRPIQLFWVQDYQYPERRVRIYFFLCRAGRARPKCQGRWVESEVLRQLQMPPANRAVIDAISCLL